MYQSLRKTLFKLDAERAHNLVVNALSVFPRVSSLPYQIPSSSRLNLSTQAGVWNFPLGVAAGLDKDARLITFFSRLGVGALEVGTVTPLAQDGNEKPRLFRLVHDESILNRMGFNGPGVAVVGKNIRKQDKKEMVLGVNLGKNKVTPNEKAIDDYLILFNNLKTNGDYFVVNVSSPNTPGLRDLQDTSFLKELFNELDKVNKENKPILLKISPDLSERDLINIVEFALESPAKGIIGTNTTIMENIGKGGVSGDLLLERAKNIRRDILNITGRNESFDVIGVGGVSEFSHLWDFWREGGKVMQIYSSLIYQGPGMFQHFFRQIISAMDYFGFSNLEEMTKVIFEEQLNLPTSFSKDS